MSSWEIGLCDLCHDGAGTCLYGWCCPFCAMASARSKYDGSDWCFNCMCGTPSFIRNIIREGYGIEGNCCNDLLVGWCCSPCASIQAIGEVKKRGSPKSATMKS
ncbi:hypothetical protein Pelo_12095 [Pelomyxa schiedti]|nr:hypothetical protein Pelo_12095 [Pelomyxa schiedti]